mmetsp:Transcript_15054/g.32278  ORF Transcript_15054/g.32278 Transcript_15054/m.32278 type:complete len:270 (+) Transcript_15054:44-853(+)
MEDTHVEHDRKCECTAARSAAWLNEGSSSVNENRDSRGEHEVVMVPLNFNRESRVRMCYALERAIFGLKSYSSLWDQSAPCRSTGNKAPFGANVLAGSQGANSLPARKYTASNPFLSITRYKISGETCTYRMKNKWKDLACEQHCTLRLNKEVVLRAIKSTASSWEIYDNGVWIGFAYCETDKRSIPVGCQSFRHAAVMITGAPALVLLWGSGAAELRMVNCNVTVAYASRKLGSGWSSYGVNVRSMTEQEGALALLLFAMFDALYMLC